jgi:hypothetical protein
MVFIIEKYAYIFRVGGGGNFLLEGFPMGRIFYGKGSFGRGICNGQSFQNSSTKFFLCLIFFSPTQFVDFPHLDRLFH